MRYLSKSTTVLATVGAIAGLTLVSAPAQAATSSIPCITVSAGGPNLDDGWGVMKGSYNLKNAPSIRKCNVTRMHRRQVLYFHCWSKNSHGNLWVYGRVKGTRKYGWMSVANFSSVHHSSYPACNWNKDKDHT